MLINPRTPCHGANCVRATGSERETDLGEVALVGVEVVDVDVVLGAPPALPATVRRRHCGLTSAAAAYHLGSERLLCGSELRDRGRVNAGEGEREGKAMRRGQRASSP